MLIRTAAIVLCVAVAPAAAQTFSRVETDPGLGTMEHILAVADLNGDGLDDLLLGDRVHSEPPSTPADRLRKVPLRIFISEGDGTFTYAPELVEGEIMANRAVVVADDFNLDGKADLAVFDAGAYDSAIGVFFGNPPQLFVSCPDGVLRPLNSLELAVRDLHARVPDALQEPAGPGDLHLKSATSGDIDADGDPDIWVESSGGANSDSHFIVNNGDGSFTSDLDRAPATLLHNPHPEYWRHQVGHLVDIDNDGDLDLALGQMRDLDPTHVNQFSIVLVNDGSGHYRTRIELPHPDFNEGYTEAPGVTHFDVNDDGLQDLILVHLRNDDALPNLPFTGRYIQVLVNVDGASFVDETSTRMGDQSATAPEYGSEGDPLYNGAEPRMHDVDLDGCADLVMAWTTAPVRTESPLVYRNNGSGQFEAMSPELFAGTEVFFGNYTVPVDVNGDGAIDFVVPRHDNGRDGEWMTGDDFTTLMTLVNTTGDQPTRCEAKP